MDMRAAKPVNVSPEESTAYLSAFQSSETNPGNVNLG